MLTVACVCVCVLVLVLLSCQGPERYRRFVEMEIKHGRLSMAAFLGVVTTYSGVRFPGYLSKAEGIKFEDIPGGAISSWAALPTAAWFQIVLVISIAEAVWLKQDPAKAPGDVIPEGVAWARYPDGYDVWLGDGSTKQVGEDELILGKTWKLNAERNNGTRHSPRTSSCPPPLHWRFHVLGGEPCLHPPSARFAHSALWRNLLVVSSRRRPRGDDGHHRHGHPRGPHRQPGLPPRRDPVSAPRVVVLDVLDTCARTA